MAFRSTLKLDSKIFDKAARRREFSQIVRTSAKEFRQAIRDKMINSPHTGRLYERRGGAGFRRRHQASRRGERPAPDTFRLVNSVVDAKTGEFSASVEVKADYGEILQREHEREIMTENDVREAEQEFNRRAVDALRKLL
jgi:hypothetical protein